MKIFNWIQKKLLHTSPKDGFEGNVKNSECHAREIDKQSLLKDVALVDMLEGWNGGILTIGTFGLESPDDYFTANEEIEEENAVLVVEDSEDDRHEDYDESYEDEELNPLILTTFNNDFSDIQKLASEIKLELGFDERKKKGERVTLADHYKDEELNPFIRTTFNNDFSDIQKLASEIKPELGFDERKKKRERVTLADLFYADSELPQVNTNKLKLDEIKVNPRTKPRGKHDKKFVENEPRSMKKLHHMMRKILKRKIHPNVVEGKKACESIPLLHPTSTDAGIGAVPVMV